VDEAVLVHDTVDCGIHPGAVMLVLEELLVTLFSEPPATEEEG
jgi:hypothetical protein